MDGSRLARAQNAQTERGRSYWLQLEINALHEESSRQYEDILELRKQNTALRAENEKLRKHVAELTATQPVESKAHHDPPSFIKANIPEKRRRKPGRPVGHEGAFRSRPRKIDRHVHAALPVDSRRVALQPRAMRADRHDC